MISYAATLNAALPVFLMAALGMALRKAGALKAEADDSLMRIIVWVVYPSLILDKLLGAEALRDPRNLAAAPLAGFLGVLAGYALGWTRAPLFRLDGARRRTFAFCVGVCNYGFLCYPIVLEVFGEAAVGALFVHNLGVEIAIWTVGIMIVSGSVRADAWRKALNGPTIAVALGVGLTLSGLDRAIPEFARGAVSLLGGAAIPFGLILSGAILMDCLSDLGWRKGWRTPVGACLINMGILPLLFIGASKSLPLSVELKHVLVAQGAMPAAIFPIVLSRKFGGDPRTAVKIVISTSALSLLLIPAWISWGV